MASDFGRVIDALPGLVWTAGPDGHADFLNQRWLEYTGLSTDEALVAGWQVAIHPDDQPALIAGWLDHVARGAAGELEARIRRHDGVYHWFNFRFHPITDASGRIVKWCGLNTDIEDLKHAEGAARTHERRFRSIIEGLPAMVTLMTPDGAFAYGNQYMIDYFDAPFEALNARPTTESFHPDDRPEVERRWKHSVDTGEPYDHEARLKGGDGVYRWFHTRGFPLRDPDGSIALWYLLQENIDDRRRADDELRASERNARALVDGFPGLVAVFSPDGFLEQVNQQVVAYWGKSAEQLKNWATAGILHPEDVPRKLAAFSKAFASKSSFELEVRGRRFDGVDRWLLSRGIPVKDGNGRIVRWYNLLIDIDERKRAEEALAASERNLKLIIDTTPVLIWSTDPNGATDSVNQHYLDYVGLSWEQLKGWGWAVAIHPDDQKGLTDVWGTIIASGEAGKTEARLRRHDGEYRWFLFRANPLRDENGNIVKWYGVNTDIEDRKRAESAVQASQGNLQLIIDATPAQLWSTLPNGEVVSVNRHYLDYVGVPLEQTLGWGWMAAVHPDDKKTLTDVWRTVLDSGAAGQAEARLRRHDGQYRWFLFRANPMRDEHGTIIRWYGVTLDIEDRKRVEAELRRANDHLSEAQRLSKTGSSTWNPVRDEHIWSEELYRIFEFEPGSRVTVDKLRQVLIPEDLSAYRSAMDLPPGDAPIERVFRIRTASGALKHLRAVAHRLKHSEELVFVVAMQDVTESKLVEQALRRSEAFLAQGEAVSETGSFLWHLETDEITWSKQLRRIFEFDETVTITLDLIATRVHPEDLPSMEDMAARAHAGVSSEYEHRIVLPDGRVKHLQFVAHPTGAHEYIGVVQDITARRSTEQALSKVRSELAHVARVTSLNALTASIAHEVNQPLAGIVTNASTCLRMLGADPPNIEGARETARRTIRDGNRAAEVITRLRALFGKKEASFELLDLNEAAREVVALSVNELQRSRVIVRQEFADDLTSVAGDRVQLQQVILNLILNATDAMSEVSDRLRILTIKTELDEDEQVRLSVQDSGVGIDPLSAARMFDAFYTTKPEGMGIGLSVSRSIIDRHQGRLWAKSNDGPGATFSFSIPRGIEARAEPDAFRTSAATDAAQEMRSL